MYIDKSIDKHKQLFKEIALQIQQESFAKGVPISYKPADMHLPEGQIIEENPDGIARRVNLIENTTESYSL